jgi:hypothetical protein
MIYNRLISDKKDYISYISKDNRRIRRSYNIHIIEKVFFSTKDETLKFFKFNKNIYSNNSSI